MTRLLVVAIAIGVSVHAQQREVDVTPRVGVSIVERNLTLDEAIQQALRNNLDIEIERTNIATAEQQLKAAQGFYDLRFGVGSTLESRTTPVANVLAAPGGRLAEHVLTPNFNLVKPTRFQGLTLNLSFDNDRMSTNNPFTGLTPFWTTRFVAGISYPLLRGRTVDAPRNEIIVRQKQTEITKTEFEQRVVDVITRTQTAYWDLAAALQDVQVESEGVRLGREQLARNQRMIASGTMAPVELAASEAELQRRLDTLSNSIGQVTIAENTLKLLLAPDRQDTIWGERLIPVDRTRVEPESDDLKAAIDRAITKRPELRGLQLRREQNDAQRVLAEDQTKPAVNLVGNYISQGLAGAITTNSNPFVASSAAQVARLNELSSLAGLAPLPPASFGGIPPALVGGYGQSISNLWGGNYQTYAGGIQIEWTPRNRTAEANLAQTGIAERRLGLQRQQLEQGIQSEVRNALQGIQTAKQRIEAAQASERAAREKLESELRLFQTGESTNFLVLTRQNELLDSRRRTVSANLLLNKAIAVLQRATGEALESNKITLKP